MNGLNKISVLIKDYDEAIQFYTEKLGFTVLKDYEMSPVKRWVEVTPSLESGCSLLLAKATTPEQESQIGNQTGGRVFLFFTTTDAVAERERMGQKGVTIVRDLSEEPYGKVFVVADLYGNKFDIIEPLNP